MLFNCEFCYILSYITITNKNIWRVFLYINIFLMSCLLKTVGDHDSPNWFYFYYHWIVIIWNSELFFLLNWLPPDAKEPSQPCRLTQFVGEKEYLCESERSLPISPAAAMSGKLLEDPTILTYTLVIWRQLLTDCIILFVAFCWQNKQLFRYERLMQNKQIQYEKIYSIYLIFCLFTN